MQNALRLLVTLTMFLAPSLIVSAQSQPNLNVPLSFEINRGQTAPQVDYLARSREGILFFTSDGLTVAVPHQGSFRLQFENTGATKGSVVPEQLLIARSNYLNVEPPVVGVENFAALRYRSVYPGIDVRFYGKGSHLEHDFLLAPGSDPGRIAIRLEGIDHLALTDKGDAQLTLGSAKFYESAPLAWQTIKGKRIPVAAAWKMIDNNRLGISLGTYDHTRAVTVDPVLVYSTHLGGTTGQDLSVPSTFPADTTIMHIGLDSARNVYVSGTTSATDFPTTAGAFDRTPNQQTVFHSDTTTQSGFVSKFDKTGRILIYSTFLRVQIDGMAVASDGHVYTAEAQFDEDPGPNFGFDEGIHIDKLSLDGSRLLFSKLFAQTPNSTTACQVSSDSFVGGLAADNFNHVWLTGITTNPCLPTTAGAFQTTLPNTAQTAFVAKFDTTKTPDTSLVYATFLGGSGVDTASALAVDASGNAYIGGKTTSSNFPHSHSFGTDTSASNTAFISKLNAAGSALDFSTLVHGVTNSVAGVALDPSDNVYLTGATTSSGFPTTASAFQPNIVASNACTDFNNNPAPCPDAFVTKLNSSGSALVYSTFLGGGGDDEATGIQVTSTGLAFVTGHTNSLNFPTTASAFKKTTNIKNAFITVLQPTGSSLFYSTLLGGSQKGTSADTIFVDPAFNAWVGGNTADADYPVTANAFQPGLKGNSDGFFAKIVIAADLKVTMGSNTSTVAHNGSVIILGTVTNLGPDGSDAVVFTEPLAAGYKFQGVSTSATSCTHPAAGATSGTIVCSKTRLESGQHFFVNVFVQAIAASGSNITSKGSATARTQDLKPSNNTALVTVHVQ